MKKEEHALITLCVVGIVHKDNKILMLERNFPPHYWCPPCGKVNKGEAIIDALEREINEESGLTVKVGDFVDIWQGQHDGKDVVSVTYLCEALSEEVTLSSEHKNFQWVSLDKITRIPTDFNTKKWLEYL